ncbi:DNA polymerase I [Patescibacteria group bacterium]|nr:DNA polymerase I [Patescibacteria group bacterium]HPD07857.1 DNA polymerase I [bacterium]HRT11127.1 DNA polymerase I [Patescibacteria group bacterium]HRU89966.1 DNA polymerase I [Patescibacteria group bacterium]
MPSADKKLVVVDGNAVTYRSFYAIQSGLSSNNQPTNAVYGFFSVLFKVINELSPDYLVVAFDRPEPTFRHELSVDYKAKRIKQPEELYSQIPIIKELLTAINVPIIELAGYEADDIIGTIVSHTPKSIHNYIVTGDKDAFQLVNDHVSVYWLQRGLQKTVILDREGVKRILGLEPEQVVDYKSLRGDASDNIMGVPGIGDKTAVSLLQSFGSLDNIQTAVAAGDNIKIKPRWRQLILANQESLDLSQKLASINSNVPIKFSLKEAKFTGFDFILARQAFLKWQLNSLIPRLEKLSHYSKSRPAVFAISQSRIIEINNVNESTNLAHSWTGKTLALRPAFDGKRITSLMLAGQNEIYQLVIGKEIQGELFTPSTSRNPILEPWRTILEDKNTKKIIFQAKEVIKFLLTQEIVLEGLSGDPLLANYLLHPGERQISLMDIGRQVGFEWGEKSGSPKDAAFGVLQIMDIHEALIKELTDTYLLKVYNEIEIPLITVLAKMELAGIKINQEVLTNLAQKWQDSLNRLSQEIYNQAGEEFNINSPKQLQDILFKKLALNSKGLDKTKNGPSTDADNLQKIKDQHPIVSLLLEYREISKLLNTYALALPKLISTKDGRLRANFHQAITATGRLSSSDPNLQNIPIRTEMGRKLRQAFVPEQGYKLISFDYSQIELRIIASLAHEDSMIANFLAGHDIHAVTAAKINGIPLEDVTEKQRRAAKAVNFGILYGQGPHGLSRATGLSYGAAKDFIEQYFTIYPQIHKYINELLIKARQDGFVTTFWGRRRYLPDLLSPNPTLRRAAERMAINFPVQGTAADIMKAAMINVDHWLEDNFAWVQARIVLQIHDEILIEASEELVDKITAAVPPLMTEIIALPVPLVVSTKVGNSWAEL